MQFLKQQLYTISLYARQASGAVVLFVIARYLSVYDYGLFSSYKSIVAFLFMLANLDFANYILVSSKANIHQVKLKSALFIINGISIGLMIAMLSCLFKLDNHLIFILVLIRTFFDSVFFALILPYFQAAKKFNTIAIINIIYAFCIAIIAIISYMLKLSLVKFLILNIILGCINFIQCSYYIKLNYFSVCFRIKDFIKKLDKSIWGYIGATVSNYMYAQTSSLYVALFLTKEDAALYFAAFNIAIIVDLLSAAQIQKMVPELIKADLSQTKEIMNKNLKYILGFLGCILIFLICFGKILLQLLYGNSYYISSYPILLIYFVANIFIANGAIWGAYLTAIDKQPIKAQMKLEASIMTILSLCLLHHFGIYGAVCSLLIASIYVSLRFTFCSLNFLKNNIVGRGKL